MNGNNRPVGISLLDYLWVNYGSYGVSSLIAESARDDTLLTESAILDLIQDVNGKGIVSLEFRDSPTKDDTCELRGLGSSGEILSTVEVPKEVHVQSFSTRTVTLDDIDSGCEFSIGSNVLSLVLTNGTEFLVDLEDIIAESSTEVISQISGAETNTIKNDVLNGLVISNLKVDSANNSASVVEIKNTSNGIYNNLKISGSDYGIELSKENDGLSAKIPFGSSYIRFVSTTFDEYTLLEDKLSDTVYFLTDYPYIYLNGVRYGYNLEPGETYIVSISYDVDTTTLTYETIDGSTVSMKFGLANETAPGMMSVETYVDILNIKNILGDLDNVSQYVEELVKLAGFSLTLGESSSNKFPINLVNGNGDIISTITLDSESYLLFAESKVADTSDVEASGGTITVGDHILILTLTSGDTLYVSLNDLVDTYSGGTTHSINTSVLNGVITSDLNISEDDQLLYIYDDGLRALILVVRESGKLIFYGKSLTDEDKITEINLPDALVSFLFVEEATEDIFLQYPPTYIDGVEYDEYSNTVSFGDPYIILSFSQDSEYTIDSYSYNSWITVIPILKTIKLSPDEGNTLTKDDNGYLFNAINWIEV